jgi:hypothetical protein
MYGWYVKLTLEVKGPDEGPVTATVEYADTTKQLAKGLQDKLALLSLDLNKRGI